mgnify:CR=1 FL=1
MSDRTLGEPVISPVFDRGYFQSIRIVSVAGETIARKDLPVNQGDVPAWFVELFPLRAPSSEVAALIVSNFVRVSLVSVSVSIRSFWLVMEKSSASPSAIRSPR